MSQPDPASTPPGHILEYDHRPTQTPLAPSSLKVVQWNIERNYESETILSILKSIDADVVILQEIDIGCIRSGRKNHMKDLCLGLEMKGGFVSEFHELDDPCRTPRDAGGGVHGNAILSKYDVEFKVLDHQHQPFNWDRDGGTLKEPRVGRRYTLIGTIQPPSQPAVLCYSVHLEVFTGIIGRITSFSEVLEHASKQDIPNQLIFGDLNTMGHSIARLSPVYCRDRYRWASLGKTESGWWDDRLFGFHITQGDINTRLARSCLFVLVPTWLIDLGYRHYPRLMDWMSKAVGSGFDEATLRAARNPGFYDPWDPEEVTLENPGYGGLFKAKLDWTLVRGMRVLRKGRGNLDYKASDHAYLWIEVAPEQEDDRAIWQSRRATYSHTSSFNWPVVVAFLGASYVISQMNVF
ncbi:Endonuclease/exonuclease/phosphatase [Phycomyces nitens]|nr:Endonuclease/exonuclease/phosphatase [Phycomyces nitens]